MAQEPGSPKTPLTPSTPRTPGFNTKSPTIKRILSESRELACHPDPSLHAAPLETDLFEWHFTIAGPPASPYAQGIYHGRIVLPPSYPLRPPSFRFVTPSGRFETNREICLSISGHHEETWQPAWGIRTALCAIRAFMAGEAKGQIGGLDMEASARERLAVQSRSWRCAGGCSGSKTNEEILQESEAEWKVLHDDKDGSKPIETLVPEELRLAYKDDMDRGPPTPKMSNPPSQAKPSLPPPSATLPDLRQQQAPLPPHAPRPMRPHAVTNLIARAKPPPSPLRSTTTASSISASSAAAAAASSSSTSAMSTNIAPEADASNADASTEPKIPTTPIPFASSLHAQMPTPSTAAYGRGSLGHTPLPTGGLRTSGMPGTPTPEVVVVPATPGRRSRTLVRARSGMEPDGARGDGVPSWVDRVIIGLVIALIVMVARRLMGSS